MKEGQAKEVMVNGRLFKIDVEEAHCKLHSSFTSIVFSSSSFFLHWGWSFVVRSCMAWGTGRGFLSKRNFFFLSAFF